MKPILEIINLSALIEDKKILNCLNLAIEPGSVHVIMGPNGAGKSTLSKVIAGHSDYVVEEGQILFDGESLLDMEVEKRALKGVFVSFQAPPEIRGVTNLHFLHVAYNCFEKARGQELTKHKAFEKMLDEIMDKLQIPHEFKHRKINEGLSGGEKKKMEVLQMILFSPKLIILDEIDSGLDIDALKVIAKAVNSMKNENCSILIITHYQRILDHIKPDHIHVMIDGKIVHSDDHSLANKLEIHGYDWVYEKAGYINAASTR